MQIIFFCKCSFFQGIQVLFEFFFLNNVYGNAFMSFIKCLWECDMIENQIWLIRFSWKPGVTFQEYVWVWLWSRLGFMNTTCNSKEHPFCTGGLCCKRRAWGHKGRYNRPSAGFCRSLWFWYTQKEGMLQFTASLGSYFYAELSEKKTYHHL